MSYNYIETRGVQDREAITKNHIYLNQGKVKIALKPSKGAMSAIKLMGPTKRRRKAKMKKDYWSEEDALSAVSDEEKDEKEDEEEGEDDEIAEESEDDEIAEESEEDEDSQESENMSADDEQSEESSEGESEESKEEKSIISDPPKRVRNRKRQKKETKPKRNAKSRKTPAPKSRTTTRKRPAPIKRRRRKRTTKLIVEESSVGAVTDQEVGDFVNKDGSSCSSKMSVCEEESEENSKIKEKVEELEKNLRQNIDPKVFIIENNEEKIQDCSSEDEEEDNIGDLQVGERQNIKGRIKREGLVRPLMYNPITDRAKIIEKPVVYSNPYDILLNRLQLNFIPEELPCRDKEKEIIRDFILSGLRNRGSSTSLYISGMPGTGKTATTLEVIQNLNSERKKKFRFIHVNGMQLNNSSVMYTLIYKEITGQKHKPTTAAVMLDDYFKKRKDKPENQLKNQQMIVLLVDELDALVTKKQTLLYNLFDWPSNKNSGLIILAIANTMDLPERFLVKIKSRIGESRLVYQPYSRSQIEKIIMSRIQGENISLIILKFLFLGCRTHLKPLG